MTFNLSIITNPELREIFKYGRKFRTHPSTLPSLDSLLDFIRTTVIQYVIDVAQKLSIDSNLLLPWRNHILQDITKSLTHRYQNYNTYPNAPILTPEASQALKDLQSKYII
jgi:hypothetical protein